MNINGKVFKKKLKKGQILKIRVAIVHKFIYGSIEITLKSGTFKNYSKKVTEIPIYFLKICLNFSVNNF